MYCPFLKIKFFYSKSPINYSKFTTTRSTPRSSSIAPVLFNTVKSTPNNELYRPIICRCFGYKKRLPFTVPWAVASPAPVRSAVSIRHMPRTADSAARYWSGKTGRCRLFSPEGNYPCAGIAEALPLVPIHSESSSFKYVPIKLCIHDCFATKQRVHFPAYTSCGDLFFACSADMPRQTIKFFRFCRQSCCSPVIYDDFHVSPDAVRTSLSSISSRYLLSHGSFLSCRMGKTSVTTK